MNYSKIISELVTTTLILVAVFSGLSISRAYRGEAIDDVEIPTIRELLPFEIYRDKLLENVSPTYRSAVAGSDTLKSFVKFYSGLDTENARDFLENKIKMLETLKMVKDRITTRSGDLGEHYQEMLGLINEAANTNFYGSDLEGLMNLFNEAGEYIYKPEHSQLDIERHLPEWTNQIRHMIANDVESSRIQKYRQKLIPFKDTDDTDWFTPFIRKAKERQIISGYQDQNGNPTGEFGPGNKVTIAEVIKMAVITAGVEINQTQPQNISARNHWARQYIATAEDLGVELLKQADLDVDWPARRAEAIRMIIEIIGVDPEELASAPRYNFTDVDPDSDYAPYIYWAKEKGIISGDAGVNTLRPNDQIVRAEVAKILVNFIDLTGRE